MGIWIRSQNKEVLRKCSKLQYNENDGKHTIVDIAKTDNPVSIYMLLGEYPTRERALEVLEEIQNHTIECEKAKFFTYEECCFVNPIFKMPEK